MKKIRSDATIEKLKKKCAEISGLPTEAFIVMNPDGTIARGNKRIGSIRRGYDK